MCERKIVIYGMVVRKYEKMRIRHVYGVDIQEAETNAKKASSKSRRCLGGRQAHP